MNNQTCLLCCFGAPWWRFFNIVTLGLAKDEQDEKNKRFNYKIWWKYQWDNVLITFLAIPLVVEFTSDLWELIVNNWFEKNGNTTSYH